MFSLERRLVAVAEKTPAAKKIDFMALVLRFTSGIGLFVGLRRRKIQKLGNYWKNDGG